MAAERLPRIAAAICPIREIALRFQPVVRHLANPVRIDKNMGSREFEWSQTNWSQLALSGVSQFTAPDFLSSALRYPYLNDWKN